MLSLSVMCMLFGFSANAQLEMRVYGKAPAASGCDLELKLENSGSACSPQLIVCNDLALESNAKIEVKANAELLMRGVRTKVSATSKVRGTGYFTFDGDNSPCNPSTEQEIETPGCTATAVMDRVKINNASAVKLIGTNSGIRLGERLKLSSGHIKLASNNLCLDSPVVIEDYCPDRFIVTDGIGLVKYAALTMRKEFPIGIRVNEYSPVAIENTGTADEIGVRVLDNVYDGGTSGLNVNALSVRKTWEVKEAVAGGSDLDLELEWLQAEEGASFDRSNMFVSQYQGTTGVGGSTTNWDYALSECGTVETPDITDASCSATLVRHKKTRFGITDLSGDQSLFALSTCSIAPLPVELVSFRVVQGCPPSLQWITSSETNNDYFEIQRKVGNKDFVAIGKVEGKGTSVNSNTYSFADIEASRGTHFYRLKQVDFDGTFEYSEIVSLDVACGNGFEDTRIFPNPTKGAVRYAVNLGKDYKGIVLQLTDMLGRILEVKTVDLEKGYNEVNFNLERYSTGVYMLNAIIDGHKVDTQKITKSE